MPEIRVIEPIIFAPAEKLRVCAYARVSSDSTDQRNSFASQVNYYTKYIQAHEGWTFVDIYADQGITGTSALKRDEFLRLMRDCRQGKIDRILVKSVSRFARNAQDCIEAVRELRQLGVTVYFEKEHINTANMSNEMFLSMMSAFAQEESISISKNMRKGAVMRMKNGTFRLSQAPYGYYLDEKGILIVQQEESKIVQRIFGNFLSGMGIQEIAAELQKEHIPKLNGEPIWSYTGILYILTNERYIGDELFQKRYTTDTLPFQKKINRGQKKQYYAEDTHDPIISREVFRKAQELLKRKSERHGHQNNGQYTFTSLIVCDECGTNFCRRIAKNQRVLWTCRKHFKGKHLCSMESLNETEIQQCFLTLYKKLAENRQEILGSYLRQLEELKDKDFMAHPDAMELNRQIAGLLEQNHTLHRLRAKECIDSAFFIAQSNELSQKISNLKAELKQYRDLNEYADFIDNTRLILTILDSPMPVFSSSVFRNIVSRITVTHETLRFQLVNGLEIARRSSKRKVSCRRTKSGRGKYTSKYALSERTVCGECGAMYRRTMWIKRDRTKEDVWRCVNRLEFGTKYCKHSPSLKEPILHQAILNCIQSVFHNKEEIAEAVREAQKKIILFEDAKNNPEVIRQRMQDIDHGMANLLTLAAQSSQIELFEKKFKEMTEEKARLTEQLKQAEEDATTDAKRQKQLDDILKAIDIDIVELTEFDDTFIRRIVEQVTILSKDKIEVRFIGGFSKVGDIPTK